MKIYKLYFRTQYKLDSKYIEAEDIIKAYCKATMFAAKNKTRIITIKEMRNLW